MFGIKKQASTLLSQGQLDLYADFEISQGQLDDIYRQTPVRKCFPEFIIYVKDNKGNVASEIQRTLYVRKKPHLEKMTKKPEAEC